MTKKLKNNVAIILDASGSMQHQVSNVISVFNTEIEHMKKKSIEMDQETRVSVYKFGDRIENLVFDTDVMRTPQIGFNNYSSNMGMTALRDATIQVLSDMAKIPELYDDHAFLIYVLTDGQENRSKHSTQQLANAINLLKDNYTLAIQVPNRECALAATSFGFPKESVKEWNVTSTKGVLEVGETFRSSMDNYYNIRSQGVRSTKSFFAPDTQVSTRTVKSALAPLRSGSFEFYHVSKKNDGMQIRDFVEGFTGATYRPGSSFYQLTKPEDVQDYKEMIIVNKNDSKAYTGDQIRTILGLPDGEFRIHPTSYGDWDIFIQSTSFNRKMKAGTKVLVMN